MMLLIKHAVLWVKYICPGTSSIRSADTGNVVLLLHVVSKVGQTASFSGVKQVDSVLKAVLSK